MTRAAFLCRSTQVPFDSSSAHLEDNIGSRERFSTIMFEYNFPQHRMMITTAVRHIHINESRNVINCYTVGYKEEENQADVKMN